MEQNEKHIRLTTAPIPGLITSLAVPTIISMLVTTFYNMADTYFVSQIKTEATSATGAVGVVFSAMAIIQAIGLFFGQGSGNFMSRKLGEKDFKGASVMASVGFFSAFIFGVVFATFGIIFSGPLSLLLGSTESILPFAKDYLSIILLGTPFMACSLVLNNQLRYQGSAVYGMVGMVSGAVINIGLDPLFIFVFDMGISGAALATILSQLCSFTILLIGATSKGNIRPSFKNFRPTFVLHKEMFRLGFPSLIRQSIASLGTICLNTVAGDYGDFAIASLSVVARTINFGASVIIGYGQGFQPVCGFNYGAKKNGRVLEAFSFSLKVTTIFAASVSVILFIFARGVISLFSVDPDVLLWGTRALRAQCLMFSLNGFNIISNMMMQNIGRVGEASFLSLARQGLFFVPAAFLLEALFGLEGLIFAAPTADLIAFICALFLQRRVLKSLKD